MMKINMPTKHAKKVESIGIISKKRRFQGQYCSLGVNQIKPTAKMKNCVVVRVKQCFEMTITESHKQKRESKHVL